MLAHCGCLHCSSNHFPECRSPERWNRRFSANRRSGSRCPASRCPASRCSGGRCSARRCPARCCSGSRCCSRGSPGGGRNVLAPLGDAGPSLTRKRAAEANHGEPPAGVAPILNGAPPLNLPLNLAPTANERQGFSLPSTSGPALRTVSQISSETFLKNQVELLHNENHRILMENASRTDQHILQLLENAFRLQVPAVTEKVEFHLAEYAIMNKAKKLWMAEKFGLSKVIKKVLYRFKKSGRDKLIMSMKHSPYYSELWIEGVAGLKEQLENIRF
ncbi:hypothetical protein CAEBREN_11501 [Caenorhabditis brenneri]|uniref:Uncharacterized protein n=1 Tax=Caenorhabditis brenneri TaxID=135651 RepID=G0P932_CAEBE|nr:hypothetical protein CAEBREN_11501 [Caenorhabditis brenneri]